MSDDADKPLRDYRETVFLPDTPFPMRAGLPTAEPKLLEKLGDLYPGAAPPHRQAQWRAALRAARRAAPTPCRSDPMGHALNKILKDFTVRSRFRARPRRRPGAPAGTAVPADRGRRRSRRSSGKEGRKKGEVSKEEFRSRCRAYAALDRGAESRKFPAAVRAGRLGPSLFDDGLHQRGGDRRRSSRVSIATHQLYRSAKPVMWSPVERTALADAEVSPRPRQPDDLGEVPGGPQDRMRPPAALW